MLQPDQPRSSCFPACVHFSCVAEQPFSLAPAQRSNIVLGNTIYVPFSPGMRLRSVAFVAFFALKSSLPGSRFWFLAVNLEANFPTVGFSCQINLNGVRTHLSCGLVYYSRWSRLNGDQFIPVEDVQDTRGGVLSYSSALVRIYILE